MFHSRAFSLHPHSSQNLTLRHLFCKQSSRNRQSSHVIVCSLHNCRQLEGCLLTTITIVIVATTADLHDMSSR
ncbi:hypothetical protein ACSQ67_025920 [Phaseolus vulgaris]